MVESDTVPAAATNSEHDWHRIEYCMRWMHLQLCYSYMSYVQEVQPVSEMNTGALAHGFEP